MITLALSVTGFVLAVVAVAMAVANRRALAALEAAIDATLFDHEERLWRKYLQRASSIPCISSIQVEHVI